jgi:predicted transcriptional regulator
MIYNDEVSGKIRVYSAAAGRTNRFFRDINFDLIQAIMD